MSLASPSVQNDKLMLLLLFIFDVGHQISIHRLLKNHDGIWTLRAGNMQLAIMKWIVLLRVEDKQTMIDMVFFQSCGFLGTRVFVTLVYILMYFGVPTKLIEEDWYSIGLVWAQFWIYVRFWDVAAPVVWLSIVSCSALYFHQLWRKNLHLRNLFVVANCIAMALALNLSKYLSLAFTIVYWCSFFWLPGFKRQPLFGHLKGEIKAFKEAETEAQAQRQVRLMEKARKSIREGKTDTTKPGMESMIKFLNVAELRRSMRASAMMMQGLSVRSFGSLASFGSLSSMKSTVSIFSQQHKPKSS